MPPRGNHSSQRHHSSGPPTKKKKRSRKPRRNPYSSSENSSDTDFDALIAPRSVPARSHVPHPERIASLARSMLADAIEQHDRETPQRHSGTQRTNSASSRDATCGTPHMSPPAEGNVGMSGMKQSGNSVDDDSSDSDFLTLSASVRSKIAQNSAKLATELQQFTQGREEARRERVEADAARLQAAYVRRARGRARGLGPLAARPWAGAVGQEGLRRVRMGQREGEYSDVAISTQGTGSGAPVSTSEPGDSSHGGYIWARNDIGSGYDYVATDDFHGKSRGRGAFEGQNAEVVVGASGRADVRFMSTQPCGSSPTAPATPATSHNDAPVHVAIPAAQNGRSTTPASTYPARHGRRARQSTGEEISVPRHGLEAIVARKSAGIAVCEAVTPCEGRTRRADAPLSANDDGDGGVGDGVGKLNDGSVDSGGTSIGTYVLDCDTAAITHTHALATSNAASPSHVTLDSTVHTQAPAVLHTTTQTPSHHGDPYVAPQPPLSSSSFSAHLPSYYASSSYSHHHTHSLSIASRNTLSASSHYLPPRSVPDILPGYRTAAAAILRHRLLALAAHAREARAAVTSLVAVTSLAAVTSLPASPVAPPQFSTQQPHTNSTATSSSPSPLSSSQLSSSVARLPLTSLSDTDLRAYYPPWRTHAALPPAAAVALPSVISSHGDTLCVGYGATVQLLCVGGYGGGNRTNSVSFSSLVPPSSSSSSNFSAFPASISSLFFHLDTHTVSGDAASSVDHAFRGGMRDDMSGDTVTMIREGNSFVNGDTINGMQRILPDTLAPDHLAAPDKHLHGSPVIEAALDGCPASPPISVAIVGDRRPWPCWWRARLWADLVQAREHATAIAAALSTSTTDAEGDERSPAWERDREDEEVSTRQPQSSVFSSLHRVDVGTCARCRCNFAIAHTPHTPVQRKGRNGMDIGSAEVKVSWWEASDEDGRKGREGEEKRCACVCHGRDVLPLPFTRRLLHDSSGTGAYPSAYGGRSVCATERGSSHSSGQSNGQSRDSNIDNGAAMRAGASSGVGFGEHAGMGTGTGTGFGGAVLDGTSASTSVSDFTPTLRHLHLRHTRAATSSYSATHPPLLRSTRDRHGSNNSARPMNTHPLSGRIPLTSTSISHAPTPRSSAAGATAGNIGEDARDVYDANVNGYVSYYGENGFQHPLSRGSGHICVDYASDIEFSDTDTDSDDDDDDVMSDGDSGGGIPSARVVRRSIRHNQNTPCSQLPLRAFNAFASSTSSFPASSTSSSAHAPPPIPPPSSTSPSPSLSTSASSLPPFCPLDSTQPYSLHANPHLRKLLVIAYASTELSLPPRRTQHASLVPRAHNPTHTSANRRTSANASTNATTTIDTTTITQSTATRTRDAGDRNSRAGSTSGRAAASASTDTVPGGCVQLWGYDPLSLDASMHILQLNAHKLRMSSSLHRPRAPRMRPLLSILFPRHSVAAMCPDPMLAAVNRCGVVDGGVYVALGKRLVWVHVRTGMQKTVARFESDVTAVQAWHVGGHLTPHTRYSHEIQMLIAQSHTTQSRNAHPHVRAHTPSPKLGNISATVTPLMWLVVCGLRNGQVSALLDCISCTHAHHTSISSMRPASTSSTVTTSATSTSAFGAYSTSNASPLNSCPTPDFTSSPRRFCPPVTLAQLGGPVSAICNASRSSDIDGNTATDSLTASVAMSVSPVTLLLLPRLRLYCSTSLGHVAMVLVHATTLWRLWQLLQRGGNTHTVSSRVGNNRQEASSNRQEGEKNPRGDKSNDHSTPRTGYVQRSNRQATTITPSTSAATTIVNTAVTAISTAITATAAATLRTLSPPQRLLTVLPPCSLAHSHRLKRTFAARERWVDVFDGAGALVDQIMVVSLAPSLAPPSSSSSSSSWPSSSSSSSSSPSLPLSQIYPLYALHSHSARPLPSPSIELVIHRSTGWRQLSRPSYSSRILACSRDNGGSAGMTAHVGTRGLEQLLHTYIAECRYLVSILDKDTNAERQRHQERLIRNMCDGVRELWGYSSSEESTGVPSIIDISAALKLTCVEGMHDSGLNCGAPSASSAFSLCNWCETERQLFMTLSSLYCTLRGTSIPLTLACVELNKLAKTETTSRLSADTIATCLQDRFVIGKIRGVVCIDDILGCYILRERITGTQGGVTFVQYDCDTA